MPKITFPCVSSLHTCLRLLTPFLYFCLIVSFTSYESSFNTLTGAMSTPGAIVEFSDNCTKLALSQGKASHRLPSLVAPIPKLPTGTRLRLENGEDDLPPIQLYCAVAGEPLSLFTLRIDPVTWGSETPSFLLPSEYGLVPFAIPPPFYIA